MTVFIDTHVRREIKKYIFREMYTFFSFFFFFLFFFSTKIINISSERIVSYFSFSSLAFFSPQKLEKEN